MGIDAAVELVDPINKYEIRGHMVFAIKDGVIGTYTKEIDESMGRYYEIYSLISGEEFSRGVAEGALTNEGGEIMDIYVDGYKSNLGIWDKGLRQGYFCVDLKMFNSICKDFKIEVNWANK